MADDLITIPCGLVAAACAAIEHKHDAPKLLEQLRRHTLGDLYQQTKAARDVLAERERQRHKWGDTHDDEHKNDRLAYGAVDYLLPGQAVMPASWAYNSKVRGRDPRRDQLVKGAALALAAIEQWDRAHGVGGNDGR